MTVCMMSTFCLINLKFLKQKMIEIFGMIGNSDYKRNVLEDSAKENN